MGSVIFMGKWNRQLDALLYTYWQFLFLQSLKLDAQDYHEIFSANILTGELRSGLQHFSHKTFLFM